MRSMTIEMGLDSFGDVTLGADGRPVPMDQVLRDVVDQAVLADQTGIDFIGLGEHHRADFAISSPEMVLAAIAARTDRIRLGSAVTVLSSDDPVRVFQRFSTLNAVSNGRAEVILGRGSFIESFPLFGYDLKDYEILFQEKLDLFVKLIRETEVSWQGTTRSGLSRQRVFPTLHQPLTTWIGVGGSPESIIRAVSYDLPVMLAVIGGPAARFRPFVDLCHRAWGQAGKPSKPVGLHSHGHVAATDEEAKEIVWPHYRTMFNRIGQERGWGPVSREQFESEVATGSQYVGSPETVARRIVAAVRTLGVQRFDMKYSTGGLPHGAMMRCIELYGTKVIPMVRDMLATDTAA
jgi:probable LLM family oxidoreductase